MSTATAHALRAASSGPVFGGNPGDVLTLQADGKAKFAAFGASGAPLTKEFWVDVGRVGSSETGSAEQPFRTIQAAIDELDTLGVTGCVLVADGDYSAEALTIDRAMAIVSLSGNLLAPASITITGGGRVELTNLSPGSVGITGGTLVLTNGFYAALSLQATQLFANGCSLGTVTGASSSNFLTLRDSALVTLLGTHALITAFDSTITTNVTATEVDLWNTTVSGTINCGTLRLNQSPVAGLVQAATQSLVDSYSLNVLRSGAHGGAHTLTSLAITDCPYIAAVVTVPALAGTFADVTIATPFVSPTDSFSVAMGNSGPVPRLAGVACVGAWSGSAGHITFRFFGTTGGGNQLLDINQHTNTG